MPPLPPSGDASLTRGLAELLMARPDTAADRARAEPFVRDWLGAFVAGWPAPAGRILSAARGSPVAQGLEGEVFLAAALSHIAETDDLHRSSVTHPACVVVPVALLLGSHLGTPGDRVLRAVLAGYEAMIRVGDALGPAHYRIFHNTATAGVFGSAAAAAELLGLDVEARVWAFGNAGTQAAGLWEFRAAGSMSKHLHAGHAAAAGLRAALLAQRGFTGPARILEGEQGFFRALCPDADPEAVLAESPGWRLPETSLKPWPCCRHTHPAIDAALELHRDLREAGSDAASVEEVQVATYSAALRITDAPHPATPWEARFSLQFCVAATLLHGAPGMATFEEQLHDPSIRSFMERVSLLQDPELEAAYPARWGGEVRVRIAGDDGAHRARRTPSATGDPERPLREDLLDAKVRDLFRWGGLDTGAGEALLRECRDMVQGGPVPRVPWPEG